MWTRETAQRAVELAFGVGYPREPEQERRVKHDDDGRPIDSDLPLARLVLDDFLVQRSYAAVSEDDWICWARLFRYLAGALTKREGPWDRASAEWLIEVAWCYVGWGQGFDAEDGALAGPTGFQNLPARFWLERHTDIEIPMGLKAKWTSYERQCWANVLYELAVALEREPEKEMTTDKERDRKDGEHVDARDGADRGRAGLGI